jgi:hypothetical protein
MSFTFAPENEMLAESSCKSRHYLFESDRELASLMRPSLLRTLYQYNLLFNQETNTFKMAGYQHRLSYMKLTLECFGSP